MKRFHVHIAVEKLDDSIRFYASLFGVAPTVVQPDYAKWMLEDPRVNFAISQRGSQPGINHLGFQVESDAELKAMRGQLAAADTGLVHTLDTIPMYGEDSRAAAVQSACCIPLAPSESKSESSACCLPLAEGTASGPDKACCA
jgi:catechol 2,3-dioxygenase-like lactoylglutathione lyase family enzyme